MKFEFTKTINSIFMIGDIVEITEEISSSKIKRTHIGKIIDIDNNYVKLDISEKYKSKIVEISLINITHIRWREM